MRIKHKRLLPVLQDEGHGDSALAKDAMVDQIPDLMREVGPGVMPREARIGVGAMAFFFSLMKRN